MKNLLILFALSSALLFAFTNKEINQIDKDFFLVGTLSDYMGRQKFKKIENRVDGYYHGEKKLFMALNSILKEEYPDLKPNSFKLPNGKDDGFELHSEMLVSRIDEFYIYEPLGGGVYNGESGLESLNLDSLRLTEDFIIANFDTVYTGRLKPEVFETEQQKMSFITGAYVRFGNHSDSLSYISIPNSYSKVQILEELLKEIGCANVRYEQMEYIPAVHKVYFSPTEKLKSYFEQYLRLR